MAVAILTERTLVGDQIRIVVKLPDDITQPLRGFFIPANATDPKAAIAAQARTSKNNDPQAKVNLSILQPGLEIDLADPIPTPPTPPTDDDLAVALFAEVLQRWLLARVEAATTIGPQSAVDALAETLQTLFKAGSDALIIRYRTILSAFRVTP